MIARMLRAIVDHNLEPFHRNAWRRYAAYFFALTLIVFCQPCFAVDTASAINTSSELLKAVSKETKEKTAVARSGAVDAKKDQTKEEAKEMDKKKIQKKVGGILTFIRKNKLAVEFASSDEGAEEMLINLDAKIKMNGPGDFSQLKQGDRVEVTYTEIYREPKEKDQEAAVLNRVGTMVRLLKAAPRARETKPDVELLSEESF